MSVSTLPIKCPMCGQDVFGEEKQVVTLFNCGRHVATIADEFDLSIETVEEYIRPYVQTLEEEDD